MKELLFNNIIEKEALENILALNQIKKCDEGINKYNEEGILISSELYNKDDKLEYKYEYDNKGNVISSVTLEPNSSPYEVVVQIPIGRIHFTWNQSSASGEHPEGYYDKECAFTIYDSNGNEIYDRKINNPLSNTTFLSLDLHDDCTTDNIDYYGINEHNKSIVDVYPNPANDFVTISGTENIDKIQIINNIGAIIETMECGNQKSVTVSTKNLASGMYFIVITNADKSTSSTKFIKK